MPAASSRPSTSGYISANSSCYTSSQRIDVERLLALLGQAHSLETAAPWQPVLPLYPTSPVGPV